MSYSVTLKKIICVRSCLVGVHFSRVEKTSQRGILEGLEEWKESKFLVDFKENCLGRK